jgi:hypothetical protein
MISDTGSYFLEKGELVVSKNFKNGGQALSDKLGSSGPLDSRTLSTSSNGVNISNLDELKKIVEEFKGLKLKVDIADSKVPIDVIGVEVPVNVGDARVKVDTEGATVKVDTEGATVKVDTEGAKVKVDTEGAIVKVDTEGAVVKVDIEGLSIPVDVSNAVVKVDTEGVTIPVNIEGLSIPVDVSSEAVKMDTTALEAAINKLTSLKLDTSNAVGAEKGDKLASVIDNLNNQVLDLKTKQASDIQMISSKIDTVRQESSVNAVTDKLYLDRTAIEQQINDVSSNLNMAVSNQASKEAALVNKLIEHDNKLNTMLTKLHSTMARGGL